jgi:hypothetical protein
MRLAIKILIFVFLSFTLTKCQVTKSDTENYIEKFTENKIEFDLLAKKINQDKFLLGKIGYSINENELDSILKAELENIGVVDINLKYSECEKTTEVEFVVNWSKNGTVYFNKNDCEKEQTKIGYHSKTTMIEVWGLGNGWYMWIDYDFI